MFKFKIWLSLENKMISFDQIISSNINILNNITNIYLLYTGINDNNKKEIYKGDIVIYDASLLKDDVVIAEVDYITDLTLASTIGFGLWVLKSKTNHNGYIPMSMGGYKIIGNIYENNVKDLLNTYQF